MFYSLVMSFGWWYVVFGGDDVFEMYNTRCELNVLKRFLSLLYGRVDIKQNTSE